MGGEPECKRNGERALMRGEVIYAGGSARPGEGAVKPRVWTAREWLIARNDCADE